MSGLQKSMNTRTTDADSEDDSDDDLSIMDAIRRWNLEDRAEHDDKYLRAEDTQHGDDKIPIRDKTRLRRASEEDECFDRLRRAAEEEMNSASEERIRIDERKRDELLKKDWKDIRRIDGFIQIFHDGFVDDMAKRTGHPTISEIKRSPYYAFLCGRGSSVSKMSLHDLLGETLLSPKHNDEVDTKSVFKVRNVSLLVTIVHII